MNKFFITIATCAILCSCTQEWGELETITYPIDQPYTELEVSDAFVVEGYTRNEYSRPGGAIVTVGSKAQSKVKVEVKNGRLYIGLHSGKFDRGGEVARVRLPNDELDKLTKLVLREASKTEYGNMIFLRDIVLQDASSCGTTIMAGYNEEHVLEGEFNLTASGASTFSSQIFISNINVTLSGASSVRLNGRECEELKINVSDASTLDCSTLQSSSVSGSIKNASKADVTCCSSLSVDVADASELVYKLLSPSCQLDFDCHWSGGSTVTEK